MLNREQARALCRYHEVEDLAGVDGILRLSGLTDTQQADLYAQCMTVTIGYLDVDDVMEFYKDTIRAVH